MAQTFRKGQRVKFVDADEAVDLGFDPARGYTVLDVTTEDQFGVEFTLITIADRRGKHEMVANDYTFRVVTTTEADEALTRAQQAEVEEMRKRRLGRSAEAALRVLGEDVQRMVDMRTPYTAIILTMTDQGWDKSFAEKFFADFLVRRYIESPE